METPYSYLLNAQKEHLTVIGGIAVVLNIEVVTPAPHLMFEATLRLLEGNYNLYILICENWLRHPEDEVTYKVLIGLDYNTTFKVEPAMSAEDLMEFLKLGQSIDVTSYSSYKRKITDSLLNKLFE